MQQRSSSSGRRGKAYRDLTIPPYFRPASADAFKSMEMRPSDVVLSSLPKGGTTWLHKILASLLYEFDDEGEAAEDTGNEYLWAQIYPEGIPLDRDELEQALARAEGVQPYIPQLFGNASTLEGLLSQPDPRIVSTHLFGEKFLPAQLVDEGKGRLVVGLRNLKDTMVSLHSFMKKGGYPGSEYDSLDRFLNPDGPVPYGNSFSWVKEQDALVTKLREKAAGAGRKDNVLVVYYESLQEDLPSELDRIASFLDLPPLTDAKRAAVAQACAFKSMKETSARSASNLRSGKVGDWRNHDLDEEAWGRFDAAFEEELGGVDIAQPMRKYH